MWYFKSFVILLPVLVASAALETGLIWRRERTLSSRREEGDVVAARAERDLYCSVRVLSTTASSK